MECWQDPQEQLDQALARKLNAVNVICDTHQVSEERREIILDKVRKGHEEHQQMPEDVDVYGELVGEHADIPGYMAAKLVVACEGGSVPLWTAKHDEYLRLAFVLWDLLDELAEYEDGVDR